MNKIAICIPTYRRPILLKKLLISLFACNIDKQYISDVTIIIVDNDHNKSAEIVINEIKHTYDETFELLYFNHSVKGLSNVRNEMFKKALEIGPDYILSIDDDEYVSNDWINQLMYTLVTNHGDIALGPVIPVLESDVSTYISSWFRYPMLPNLKRIKFFWTSSYIISVKFLLKHQLEFDIRFNTSGGEDTYFGVTALKKGAKIYWAKDAIAYETIPENRTKLKWLAKRCFNGAANYTYILKLENNYFGLLKKSIISILYLMSGIISLVLIPFPFRWKYWSILKISESFGGFAGLLSIQLHEYEKEE
jgi:succinoglycan biosynthesis protein ExoM